MKFKILCFHVGMQEYLDTETVGLKKALSRLAFYKRNNRKAKAVLIRGDEV